MLNITLLHRRPLLFHMCNWTIVQRAVSLSCSIAFCLLSFSHTLEGAESQATLSIQINLAEEFPNFDWEQSSLVVTLLDDQQDLSSLLAAWKEESKVQLEPLVKEYMYTAELLTRLARQERVTEREQALCVYHEREKQIQDILHGYSMRIDRIFQEKALQVLREIGQAVMRIDFQELPPGTYRAHVVLTCATTTFQWFEAFEMKGGDVVLRVLTRETLNNPYWTELDWWKFINLDFSKHH